MPPDSVISFFTVHKLAENFVILNFFFEFFYFVDFVGKVIVNPFSATFNSLNKRADFYIEGFETVALVFLKPLRAEFLVKQRQTFG